MADWREEKLTEELSRIGGFQIDDLCRLDVYDTDISQKVLSILLEWACYGQSEAGIMLGRRKISEIPVEWLEWNLVRTVKKYFDYSDDWNYRRLLEVVVESVPKLKEEILLLNEDSNDQEILEIRQQFKEGTIHELGCGDDKNKDQQ